jgi:hypothetical protein
LKVQDKMKINYKLMESICLADIKDFIPLGDVVSTQDGIYIYKPDEKAHILGVAHLDSVLDLTHFHKMEIRQDTYVVNAQLDDRLGVYILLDMLPKMGIHFDLLLTEGEETGRSTAQYFESEKEYNWIFSFDRHGSDVVMYQYDCPELRKDLKKVNMKAGNGSFSDIAFLDQLGVRGINVGTGYEGEHSDLCYASMAVMQSQIAGFKRFYDRFQSKKYTYTESDMKLHYSKSGAYGNYFNGYGNYSRGLESMEVDCILCGYPDFNGMTYYNGEPICHYCMKDLQECAVCHELYYGSDITDGTCNKCRNRLSSLESDSL